ncbi:MAG: ribonuclease HII [Alphaproteobacteria bacterium]|nr:ribonuclease HII [Alphaproteobacteria bacterium]
MPNFEFENQQKGLVVGIDEAGRGPWAGPVAAGAVIFLTQNIDAYLLENLDDSKKISSKKRESLYEKLLETQNQGQLLTGVGLASAEEIDTLNILQATFLAMNRAVAQLQQQPAFALVDGNQKPKGLVCPCQTIVKGDARSYSIAAASIMAKVYRDRLMRRLGEQYPMYGFEKNAGYGTKAHIEGLKKYGIVSGVHRLSYAPIAKFLQKDVA